MRRIGQIRKHWRLAIAAVIVLILSWIFLPNVKAETIIERHDEKGNVKEPRYRFLQGQVGAR